MSTQYVPGSVLVPVIYCCVTNELSGFYQHMGYLTVLGVRGPCLATGSESPTRLQSRCQWVPRCHLETNRGKICFQAHVHGCWQEPVPCGLLDRGPQWCCPQFLAMGHRAAHNMAAGVIKTSKGASRLARRKLQSYIT